MGNPKRDFVRLGNCMVSRMLLYSALMRAKRALYLLEQPLTSLMDSHDRFHQPPWNEILSVSTWMGCYGGPTPKPTRVMSLDFNAIYPLKRTMTPTLRAKLKQDGPETVIEFIQDGKVRCTGNRQVLKSSQVYPDAYGTAVIRTWEKWRKTQIPPQDESSSDSDYETNRPRCRSWREANLKPVLDKLQRKHGRLAGHF